MKRFPLFLVALSLGACSADATTPTEPVASPPAPSFAKPALFDNEVHLPVEGTLENPCNGQEFDVSGTAHLLMSVRTDGVTVQRRIHVNGQNLSGVAADGTRYNYIAVEQLTEDWAASSGIPWSQTIQEKLKMVSAGKQTPDYGIQLSEVVGQDADGNFYVEVTHLSETCR